MERVETKKLAELIPDLHNANKGTAYGRGLLEDSLRELGAGRSILLDKKGRIIAGNKTVEVAGDIGLEDVIVVKTSGHQIVAVQREDLDLEEGNTARRMAYADNRVTEVDLVWDYDAILEDLGDGINLKPFFTAQDLSKIQIPDANKEIDEDELAQTSNECPSCGFKW